MSGLAQRPAPKSGAAARFFGATPSLLSVVPLHKQNKTYNSPHGGYTATRWILWTCYARYIGHSSLFTDTSKPLACSSFEDNCTHTTTLDHCKKNMVICVLANHKAHRKKRILHLDYCFSVIITWPKFSMNTTKTIHLYKSVLTCGLGSCTSWPGRYLCIHQVLSSRSRPVLSTPPFKRRDCQLSIIATTTNSKGAAP